MLEVFKVYELWHIYTFTPCFSYWDVSEGEKKSSVPLKVSCFQFCPVAIHCIATKKIPFFFSENSFTQKLHVIPTMYKYHHSKFVYVVFTWAF